MSNRALQGTCKELRAPELYDTQSIPSFLDSLPALTTLADLALAKLPSSSRSACRAAALGEGGCNERDSGRSRPRQHQAIDLLHTGLLERPGALVQGAPRGGHVVDQEHRSPFQLFLLNHTEVSADVFSSFVAHGTFPSLGGCPPQQVYCGG